MIQLTHFAKTGGALTKRISLAPDGSLRSDGSECIMGKGTAKRVVCATLHEFAVGISEYCNHEAIALGALRSDLPDEVQIITKSRLEKLNGSTANNVIARTSDHILYRVGHPAPALIDIDTKGIPDTVRDRIKDQGGYWAALASVVPELEHTARVERRSTTTGISRADTGEELPGSDGSHVFPLVQDGADIERFLRTLHDRCWLAGFGWFMVGVGGQLLERSIVDRMVYAPERLVFEGAPVLDPPLLQDLASRKATVTDGAPLDTVAACPPLTIVEQVKLDDLRARDVYRLAPGRAKARDQFIREQTARIAKRTGCTVNAARRTAERQCDGILLSDIVLPFDDADLAGCTVNDVLADPDRFVGATLADPLEGVEYGKCKAKVMRRASGTVWINSFAHGQTIYELKLSTPAIEKILHDTSDDQLIPTFVRLVIAGDMKPDEQQRLRDEVSTRTSINKRVIDQSIKHTRKEHADKERQEKANQRAAERTDPRPRIPNPLPDSPWLPQMGVLNEVLGKSSADEPTMRDAAGYVTDITLRPASNMHALTALGSNGGDTIDTRMPAPEHPLLTRLDCVRLSEVIERHIDYVDDEGRSVHLNSEFVKHYLKRTDGALPVVRSVATLPIVLSNGKILSGRGLNRDIGIVFRVPPELEALIPKIEDCNSTAVANAMQFLTDEWLCDVACDYTGKCVLISIVASILERMLLPERPAFFIDAGQRGSGKTTATNMISVAALGVRAAAAAWSPNEEERRKAYLAYAIEGVAAICWDNIPRGESISCPTLEKTLTAETYSDRVLGLSEFKTVLAIAIHVFTGNNVQPKGDMASRSLRARFEVDRTDPENRPFKHPDPIGWTEANRGRILQAIYTVLLGNPRLRQGSNLPPAETRFKTWWHLVGSAIENAAQQHTEHVNALVMEADDVRAPGAVRPEPISFRDLFAAGEAGEDQTSSLGDVLATLRKKWPSGFQGSEVAAWIEVSAAEAVEFRVALEQASGGKAIKVISSKTVTWRLKAITSAPVNLDDGATVALKFTRGHHGGAFVVRSLR